MSKMINKKRLEKYEQLITNALQPNTDLLLGSKTATEGLMANISQIKANLIDYTRVYTKYMREIAETEDMDERKEMVASAECAFSNMMGCVAETMGMGAVFAMQTSVYEGVDQLMSRYGYKRKIAHAHQTLDRLMLEILKATATTGPEGTIIRTKLKSVKDYAEEAMKHYPAVFSTLNLFNTDSDISSDIARAKEFPELRDAMLSDTRIDEATVDELIQRLMNDMEVYKDGRPIINYFNDY